MDITRVDEKRQFTGKITVVHDGEDEGPVQLWNCTLKFSPPGWVTVQQGSADEQKTSVFPASAVLAISDLEEAPTSSRVQVW